MHNFAMWVIGCRFSGFSAKGFRVTISTGVFPELVQVWIDLLQKVLSLMVNRFNRWRQVLNSWAHKLAENLSAQTRLSLKASFQPVREGIHSRGLRTLSPSLASAEMPEVSTGSTSCICENLAEPFHESLVVYAAPLT